MTFVVSGSGMGWVDPDVTQMFGSTSYCAQSCKAAELTLRLPFRACRAGLQQRALQRLPSFICTQLFALQMPQAHPKTPLANSTAGTLSYKTIL